MTPKQKRFCDSYENLKDFAHAKVISGFTHPWDYGDRYYVYFLVNPFNNQIFYIGKGKGNRAEHHLRENRTRKLVNGRKHKIINEIVDSGEEPQIIVFANDLEERSALTLERILIRRFKKYITNSSSGVTDKYERRREWARACLRKRMPYEKWLTVAPRSEKDKSLYYQIWQTLEKVASGEEKLYDTVKITQRNGFTCVEYS